MIEICSNSVVKYAAHKKKFTQSKDFYEAIVLNTDICCFTIKASI